MVEGGILGGKFRKHLKEGRKELASEKNLRNAAHSEERL